MENGSNKKYNIIKIVRLDHSNTMNIMFIIAKYSTVYSNMVRDRNKISFPMLFWKKSTIEHL